ncbi:MAG: PQQ-binding-like beta-propeller repeat protein [Gemmatimonadaceae bacterium]
MTPRSELGGQIILRSFLLIAAVSCATRTEPTPIATTDWKTTGGDPGNSRYSALDQINRGNVRSLRVAWTYHTGDAPGGNSQIQATPIVVDGILYTTTPALAVIALSADSGRLIWRFDPFRNRERETHANRGVVYWAAGSERRIFFSAGRRLYALDATTGEPIRTFGDSGWVDLTAGLSRDIGNAYLVATSPGAIFADLLIQGTRVGEEEGSAPGDIRAYDVHTGKIRWTFHTIPHPAEFGYDTWPADAWKTAGGANSWPGMAVDVKRGIVYVPTGSATPDFYGGDRIGQNLFANTLLALDARTGKRIWHFQTVHHDLWDRDLPAAPNLLTVTRFGKRVDAVAQISKSGFVFLFDRETGSPLFRIDEQRVPPSDLAGERAWPTQPIPAAPQPFARQWMAPANINDLSPTSLTAGLERWGKLRRYDRFAPPSVQGTVLLPGFDGGGEWGGAAIDPETDMIYVNASDVPWILAMRPTGKIIPYSSAPRTGEAAYAAVCSSCHGMDRSGKDRNPSLAAVGRRLSDRQIRQIIDHGRGFMPSFIDLREDEKQAVIAYLLGRQAPPKVVSGAHPPRSTPDSAFSQKRSSLYEFVGYERWRDSAGYPAIKPPWGWLAAVQLDDAFYRWRVPLGEHEALTARGIPVTGTEQYGGPIVTAGGLVFIGATMDEEFRAIDKVTGKVLWETSLPAAGYATPCTYSVRGKQYVVIAAGGGKLGTKSGDAYVAFALP